jgi:hypothetical protein
MQQKAGSTNVQSERNADPIGQSLVASDCYVHLDMQSDGNLVIYYGPTVAWASNTAGRARTL